MFGAEKILFNRCVDEDVFRAAEKMVEDYKDYFVRNGQTVYENPSPGNKAGGITTLEDKSCGCVQKGGDAPVTAVLQYGEAAKTKGLNLLYGPGNDLVSTTALTAAGAQGKYHCQCANKRECFFDDAVFHRFFLQKCFCSLGADGGELAYKTKKAASYPNNGTRAALLRYHPN